MTQLGVHIQHFLLVFDHNEGSLIEMVPFGRDSEGALAAYAAKEKEYGTKRRIEIVLIGSDSLDTVKRTHANYFDKPVAPASKYFDLVKL